MKIYSCNKNYNLTMCKTNVQFEIWDTLSTVIYEKCKTQYNECFQMYVHVVLTNSIHNSITQTKQ